VLFYRVIWHLLRQFVLLSVHRKFSLGLLGLHSEKV
jgi:hypothetical protein